MGMSRQLDVDPGFGIGGDADRLVTEQHDRRIRRRAFERAAQPQHSCLWLSFRDDIAFAL